MIDTHTHLYFPEYGEDIFEIMLNAQEIGVKHFVLPNVNVESIQQMKHFHQLFPSVSSMALGLHPTEVREDWEKVLQLMEDEINNQKYVAIGETGIDLYWEQDKLEIQQKAFRRQLILANQLHLPVIIHSREAFEETMQVIEDVKPEVPLIFHSFTGNKENVKRIRHGCDPYFGINGVVTYKNAPELREALAEIGINRIILETDAPYLTPVPHRGKRNDSSYLGNIRDKVAETLTIPPDLVEEITDQNACKIFGI